MFTHRYNWSAHPEPRLWYSSPMDYTLITASGKVMTFYIERCAQVYQSIYGGVIVTSAVLDAVSA